MVILLSTWFLNVNHASSVFIPSVKRMNLRQVFFAYSFKALRTRGGSRKGLSS